MKLEDQAEQILLESTDDLVAEPSEDTFRKISAHLVQIQKWKRRSLGTQILDNKYLYVKKYEHGRSSKYWVNLLFTAPEPRHERYIDWRWGIGALIMLASAIALAAAEYYLHVSAYFVYFNSVTVILATFCAIGFLAMGYRSRNSLIFTTLHGQIPVLELAVNKPSKEAFNAYVGALSLCIAALQKHYASKMKDVLANELAEHRRLRNSQVISEREYEIAKDRILSRH